MANSRSALSKGKRKSVGVMEIIRKDISDCGHVVNTENYFHCVGKDPILSIRLVRNSVWILKGIV